MFNVRQKNTPPARLLEALQEAASGGAPMSPNIANRVVRLFREFRPPAHTDYHLTPQEISLLKLLIEGHHKKTAARAMEISVHTVSFHLKNIYEKLQVHSKPKPSPKPCANGLFEIRLFLFIPTYLSRYFRSSFSLYLPTQTNI